MPQKRCGSGLSSSASPLTLKDQKDLGEKTAELAKAMNEFNPDDTWKPVE
jgi:hypothetical protein